MSNVWQVWVIKTPSANIRVCEKGRASWYMELITIMASKKQNDVKLSNVAVYVALTIYINWCGTNFLGPHTS